MRALVTGASGFLGRHLVRALQTEGRETVALSLRDPRLAAGDTVFHLAAVRNHPRVRVRDMEEINVRATIELARRCLEAGVGRFVHVSTAFQGSFGAYADSKARAVQEIRRLAAEGLPAVIVSPTIVFGPDEPTHSNRITSEIRRLLRQRVVLVVAGGRQARNLVYVDDIVRGLLAAEQRGAVGEEYVLGGEDIAPRDFGRLVLSLAGLRPLATLSLPGTLAHAMARIADIIRQSDAGSGYTTAVQVLLREWRFVSDKARRDLDYHPLPLAEGLAHTIEFLRAANGNSEVG